MISFDRRGFPKENDSPSVTGWLAIKSQRQNICLLNLKTYDQQLPYHYQIVKQVRLGILFDLLLSCMNWWLGCLYFCWLVSLFCHACKIVKMYFNLAAPGKSSLYPHIHNLELVNINNICEPLLNWTSIVASKYRGAQQVGLQQNETGPGQILRKRWEYCHELSCEEAFYLTELIPMQVLPALRIERREDGRARQWAAAFEGGQFGFRWGGAGGLLGGIQGGQPDLGGRWTETRWRARPGLVAREREREEGRREWSRRRQSSLRELTLPVEIRL